MAVAPTASPLDPAYVEANHEVVRRVVSRLSATGLVDGTASDPVAVCAESEKVRDFLNMEIPNIHGSGPLDASFKRMRRSARDLVRAGGPQAATFRDDPAYFEACREAMRLTLGDEVATLSGGFALA